MRLQDFILFTKEQFAPTSVAKDNTGKREYMEGMVFPTLDFPSDHGIVSSVVEPITAGDKTEL